MHVFIKSWLIRSSRVARLLCLIGFLQGNYDANSESAARLCSIDDVHVLQIKSTQRERPAINNWTSSSPSTILLQNCLNTCGILYYFWYALISNHATVTIKKQFFLTFLGNWMTLAFLFLFYETETHVVFSEFENDIANFVACNESPVYRTLPIHANKI